MRPEDAWRVWDGNLYQCPLCINRYTGATDLTGHFAQKHDDMDLVEAIDIKAQRDKQAAQDAKDENRRLRLRKFIAAQQAEGS